MAVHLAICGNVWSGWLLHVSCLKPTLNDVPNLKDPQMISAGRELFQAKQCTYCHGSDGKGAVRLAGRGDLEPT